MIRYPFLPVLQLCGYDIRRLFIAVLLWCSCITAIQAQVQVNATEGTALATYATLHEAFDAINAGLHNGSVNIVITGTVTETQTATLLASGSGAALYTDVMIQPQGAAVVTGSIAGAPLIDLDGADHVTIDGLGGVNSLVIENTSTASLAGTSTIRLIHDATFNTLANCAFLGSSTCSVSGQVEGGTILFSTAAIDGTGNDSNVVVSCSVGPSGSNLPTRAIASFGSSDNANNTISNSLVFDFFAAAAQSRGIDIGPGNSAWRIVNNRIYQTAPRTQTSGAMHRIISIESVNGSQFDISGNTIGYAGAIATGLYTIAGVTGTSLRPVYITVSNADTSVIQNNTIAGFNLSGALSGSGNNAVFSGIAVIEGAVTVRGNTIGSSTVFTSVTIAGTSPVNADVIGIYTKSASATVITANSIGAFSMTNANGPMGWYGIRASGSPSSVITVSDNLVGSNTILNSINNNATGNASRVVGIQNDVALQSAILRNTIVNLTMSAGNTGAGTAATLIGINQAASSSLLPSQHSVNGNKIYVLRNSNTTAAIIVSGIVIAAAQVSGSVCTVNGNLLHSFRIGTSNEAAEIRGIQVLSGLVTSCTNNMIRLGIDGAGTSVSGPFTICGILESGGGTSSAGIASTFAFNSVYIGGNNVSGASSSFAFRSLVSNTNRIYKNNIFFNARSNGSGTGKHYAIGVGGSGVNPTGLSSDNNIFYTTGAGGIQGSYDGADQETLAAWQLATGQDANSYFTSPGFTAPAANATLVDLHIIGQLSAALNNKGVALPGITTDFDLEERNASTPDIGADEFEGPPCSGSSGGTISAPDTVFCGSGMTTITATGYSIGANTLYEWEYSADNFESDTTLTGNGNPGAFSTGLLTAPVYYRLRVTCTNTGSTGYSNILLLSVVPFDIRLEASDSSICAGDTVTIAETGGTATEWLWTPTGATTSSITVTPNENTTYTVTAQVPGCTATTNVTITVNPLPAGVSAVASPPSICGSGTTSLTGTVTGASPTILSESFNDGAGNWTTVNQSTGGNIAAAAWTLRPAGYTYASTVFSSNDNSRFYLSNSDAQGSAGQTRTELRSPVFSTAGYTGIKLFFYHFFRYAFSGDTAFVEISTNNGADWQVLKRFTAAAGGASAFVQETISLDQYAGRASVYIRFRYTASWDWYWAIDNITVTGEPAALNYAWASEPAGFFSSEMNPQDVEVSAPTQFTFTVTGAGGCSAAATTVVSVNPLPVPATLPSGNVSINEGGSRPISTVENYTAYLWNTGETTSSIIVTEAGSYAVTVTDENGCSGTSAPVVVTVTPCATPVITASGSTTNVCPQNTVTLTASAAQAYLWNTGATTRSITISAGGTYSVTTRIGICTRTSAPVIVTYQGCPAPTSPVVSNITSTSARLSWRPPASCAIGFQLQYKRTDVVTWTTLLQTSNVRTITGLVPGATYQWRVLTGCRQSPPIISTNLVGPLFNTLTGFAAVPPPYSDALKESSATLSATVTPNPARQDAILHIYGASGPLNVVITDITGKQVWRTHVAQTAQVKLPARQLVAGVYFVKVADQNRQCMVKCIIQ